jgi:EAL domain-containing protein (putative c-di-GMP-specific phosphodiesterase class I)
VLHEIERPLLLDSRPLAIRASVGVACFPEHGASAETLLQKADVAMYLAKSDRQGIAVYAPDRERHTHRRLTLIGELRQALDARQFVLDYQPIVHLKTGVVAGVEALVRWNHPQHGRLLPVDFVDLAEQTGLINQLTTIVLDTALGEWSGLETTTPLTVGVNLSPRNLQDPELPQRVEDFLNLHGAAPSTLALEITENVLLTDPTRSMDCLQRLHAMGVRIVIDDFGTGYSSLSYLRRLPVNELKIDRSFIADLSSGRDDVIVRSTIDLAHNLGLTVVGEGVESARIHDQLLALGCDTAQGSYIADPAPVAQMRGWIARQGALGPL